VAARPAETGLLIVCDTVESLAVADRAAAIIHDRVTLADLDDATMRLELGLVRVALVVSTSWSTVAALTRQRSAYNVIGFSTADEGQWACDAVNAGADAYLASTHPAELQVLLAYVAGLAAA
jgi:DNA-binding NarL/FixJ family response regulator